MTNFETLLVSLEEKIATITLNRSEKLNALNEHVLHELAGAVALLGPDGELAAAQVVIITGAGGKAFVAGADIASMVDMTVLQGRAFSELGHRVFEAIGRLPQPVIAAVDGFALGGGLELALACDLIYASDTSRFGQPEVNLGVIPGFGGTQRLSRLVGPAKARELIFTGDIIKADEALRLGLVQQVFPKDELMDRVRERAALIASKAPLAISQAKRAINLGFDLALERSCELEQQAFGLLFGTEDRSEGMTAFLEKRKAAFQGK